MTRPTPCIIDTDPGVDDVLAILLALSSSDLLVIGITLTHGNCTLPSAADNLKKTFYALEKEMQADPKAKERYPNVDTEWRKQHGAGPIEVYLGSEGPIEGKPVTAKYFHGKDGLGDSTTRHPDIVPPSAHTSNLYTLHTSTPALQGVQSLLARHETGSVAYVALGPLTSLAQLHRATPADEASVLNQFAVILSMGGAVDHPGNTSPVAEFNYYADPHAAQTIFALALPHLYILPLDLTSYLVLPFSLYQSAVDPSFADTTSPSQAEGKRPLVHFTSSFLERTREIMRSFGSEMMEQHDPTVVYALMDWAKSRQDQRGSNELSVAGEKGALAPEWEWRHVDFEVETTGTITRGMLVQDHRQSSQSSTSMNTLTGLTNRAEAVEALDIAQVEAHRAEGEETREKADERRRRSGARVVCKAPGNERLQKDLLRSIWGVEV
ncbi:hypothetical protein JCM10908_005764 [Rhodotorula pacifica]|uniref:uncharacterized protein n=1 Tax=Rhodotorula pacifica TaxID=1495444 RepID=UPI0031738A7E